MKKSIYYTLRIVVSFHKFNEEHNKHSTQRGLSIGKLVKEKSARRLEHVGLTFGKEPIQRVVCVGAKESKSISRQC